MNIEWRYIFKSFLFVLFLEIAFFVRKSYVSYLKTCPVSADADKDIYIRRILINSDYAAGQVLFKNNCARCHFIYKRTESPFLSDSEKRFPDNKLLCAFIKNSDSVIKSGNPYFRKEYIEYNRTKMRSFPKLTDKDIRRILYYIKVQSMYASYDKLERK
jgi:hypothetical protein